MRRRRLLGWAVVTAGAAKADDLRTVAIAHGFSFGEDRTRILAPVLAMRRKQLEQLRGFEVADGVGPSAGMWEI